MSADSTDNTSSKFKNYSINVLIVVLIIATVYLAYNFIKRDSIRFFDANVAQNAIARNRIFYDS